MDGITRKLGPLPVWAWAALAVGGFVLLRMRKPPTSGQPNQIYGGELNPENAPGYPGNFALNPGSLVPSSATTTTNAQGTTGTSTDTSSLAAGLYQGPPGGGPPPVTLPSSIFVSGSTPVGWTTATGAPSAAPAPGLLLPGYRPV